MNKAADIHAKRSHELASLRRKCDMIRELLTELDGEINKLSQISDEEYLQSINLNKED